MNQATDSKNNNSGVGPRRIEMIRGKKLIGKSIQMSFSEDKTRNLWQSFMPYWHKIGNQIGSELYSVEVYPPDFFQTFDPAALFKKWAAVEVSDLETIHETMEILIIPSGLYAVFVHRGLVSDGPRTYSYIFETWLPQAEFVLDNRPHLAVMGEKYKPTEPDSEEEIWIPVRHK